MSFDVAWCVFCNVLFKKYSDTWIKASPVGHIGDLSIEEYTKLCYDESLISENDKESQAMYIYYLCSIKDSYGISLQRLKSARATQAQAQALRLTGIRFRVQAATRYISTTAQTANGYLLRP